jgi:ABC-type transporter Mla maintaining outer membrane lipid asymmetry permease subunit MlaE
MRFKICAAACVEAFCRGPVGAAVMTLTGLGAMLEAGCGSESIGEYSKHLVVLSCAVVLLLIWDITSFHATLENFRIVS